MENLVGQFIHEYRLTWLIDRGGYGAVYHAVKVAQDDEKETEVAIKVFLDINYDASDRDTFWREARSIDQLSRKNPHVIKLLSFGKIELSDAREVYHLIMPYYARGSLNRLTMPIDLSLAVKYIADVANGLQHLHNQQPPMIHLDVTPANILLDDEGNAILSDFSLASLTQGVTNDNTLGVPAFMAPERFRGESSPSVDQYALAVICYKLLTGEFPFPGPFAADYEIQHSNDFPASLCDKNPAVTKNIEAVLFKALAKDPKDRYDSVKDFANELRNASLPIDQRLTPTLPMIAEAAGGNERGLVSRQQLEVILPLLPQTPSVVLPVEPTTSLHSPRDRASRRRSPYPNDRVSRRKFISDGAVAVGAIFLVASGAVELAKLSRGEGRSGPQAVVSPTPKPTPQRAQVPLAFGSTIHVENHDQQHVVTFGVLSPDGSRVASGGNSQEIRVWDVNTGGHALSSSYSNIVNDVVWDPRLQSMYTTRTEGDAISTERMAIAVRDAYLYVIDPVTGQRDPLPNDRLPFSALKLAWAFDGLHIACAVPASLYEKGGVYIADDPDNCVAGCIDGMPYAGHNTENGNVLAVAFSPNCQLVASGGDGKTIHIWRRDNQQAVTVPLVQPQADAILSLAFSPDGKRLVAGSANSTACVWNIENLHNPYIETTYIEHDDDVNAVAWSHDGKFIASASADKSNNVHIWHPDGTFYGSYQNHTTSAHTVAWSPNDDFIVSSEDHAVHVWSTGLTNVR